MALEKKRDSNLELFRIVTMLLIVAHHYVVNSGLRNELFLYPFGIKELSFFVVGAWGKVGINCFVLITGYFMCTSKITLRKFIKLILQIEFYTIAIYLIFVFTGYETFSLGAFLKTLIPVYSITDNFIQAFLVFYLCIPFLNVLIHNINERMHIRLVLLCLFVYTVIGTIPVFEIRMNYVSWFVVIYFIASYIRLYPKAIFNSTKFWGYATIVTVFVSMLSVLSCLVITFKTNIDFFREPYYFVADANKILAVLTSVSAFLFFKNLKVKYSKFINIVSSATFGVLLIHANSKTMRYWLWKETLNVSGSFSSQYIYIYIHLVASVLAIYAICTIIDLLRIRFLEKPFFKWYDKKSKTIYTYFEKIEKYICDKFNIS